MPVLPPSPLNSKYHSMGKALWATAYVLPVCANVMNQLVKKLRRQLLSRMSLDCSPSSITVAYAAVNTARAAITCPRP